MSAYGEYKYGLITEDQYRAACRLEEYQGEQDDYGVENYYDPINDNKWDNEFDELDDELDGGW